MHHFTPTYPNCERLGRDGLRWITIIQCDAHVPEEVFWIIANLYVTNPEVLVPPILRADIIHDSENDALICPIGRPFFRKVARRLISKQRRDIIVHQNVYYGTRERGCHVVFEVPDATMESLPFFIPKVRKFAYVYTQGDRDNGPPRISLELCPFETDTDEIYKSPAMLYVYSKTLRTLHKHTNSQLNGYKKRVHHDRIIPKVTYQDRYFQLKQKYMIWVDQWVEKTDARKHVFEEVAIAAFLILLFEDDIKALGRKPTFVDLGCGNGFLTYILNQEGFEGVGIDMTCRKSWSLFGNKANLKQECLTPDTMKFQDADWIIGDHPDELTLWVPICAARSGYKTKFVIIPCCFHRLDGGPFSIEMPLPISQRRPSSKNCNTGDCEISPFEDHTSRLSHLTHHLGSGRYSSYITHCEKLIQLCGYIPECEFLRIPSTKNIALVGRTRRYQEEVKASGIQCSSQEWERLVLDDIHELTSGVLFMPRTSDHEKESLRRERMARRKDSRSIDVNGADSSSWEVCELFQGLVNYE
ncbi:hypothetical protein SeMB42_g00612 [Synchytrium endobioticum]|uniref:tRNA (uracil-O(2)-)-methyltransferase n=1 Tax=Synchytrium endobioticum TaxID=286115 RepID=A0A507DS44_9FUNG|nr:hypothetical protein SeLEV6574_g04371 [Synchytrium endobioticum]TPX53788.1 hypothetical protein SeMB42_g00614 [Synchytrium endobioticum]TPX53790.1 hypothetical protein SeMB42_g00612 [Synchytrium endobioticum]